MTRRRSNSRTSSRESLRLYAPTRTLWLIALLLFLVGLSGTVLDVGIWVDRSLALWALIGSSGLLLFATAVRTG